MDTFGAKKPCGGPVDSGRGRAKGGRGAGDGMRGKRDVISFNGVWKMTGICSIGSRRFGLRFFAAFAAAFAMWAGFAGCARAQSAPYADFMAVVRTSVAPFTVTFSNLPMDAVVFTNLQSVAITNRIWSFGDGATASSTEASISHTYGKVGANTVKLVAQWAGGTDACTHRDYVVVASCPPQLAGGASLLNFGSVAVGACGNRSLAVVNKGCMNLDGTVEADWPFTVTGGIPFSVAPGATGLVTVSFCPPAADNYAGLVRVASDGGSWTTRLSAIATPGASLTVSPTNYDFGMVATGQTARTAFVVSNAGMVTLVGTVTVSGAFAVIGPDSFKVAAHGATTIAVGMTPEAIGAVTSDVVFASNGGLLPCRVVGTGAVPLQPDFVADVRGGQVPFTVTFTDRSSGDITNRFWSFGDGTTSNEADPEVTHSYAGVGSITVGLIVQGAVGTATNMKPRFILATNSAPQFSVMPASLGFGTIPVGQSKQLSLAVVNKAPVAMNGIATAEAPFEIVAGSPYTIAPGETNLFTVRFRPQESGVFSGGAVIASDGGTLTGAVRGVATAPAILGVSPASFDFGYVVTGRTATTTFVVTNSGDTMLAGTATAGGPFAIVGRGSFNLASHTATNITVSFSPAFDMPFMSPLVFVSNGGGSTNSVAGAGAILPHAAFVADVRTGQIPHSVTFVDRSTGTITNRCWSFGDGATSNTGAIVISHTYTTAAPNTVQLTVEGHVGADTSTKKDLIVATNCPSQIVVASPSLDFNKVVERQTNVLRLTVMNIGCVTLTGRASVGGPFSIASGSPFTIEPGASNDVAVAFSPVRGGQFSNRVVIVSSGGNATGQVAGTSLSFLSVRPLRHDWGAVATGRTEQTVFVVTNRGESALAGTTTVSGAFSVLGDGSFKLAGHESSNIVIQFTPRVEGPFSGDVVFKSNGGGSTNPVTGIGAALPQAIFIVYSRTGQIPFTVDFTDSSTGNITNRFWSFGDGSTTSALSTIISHTYVATSTNTVQLIAQGPAGADTNTQPDYIVLTNCAPRPVFSPAAPDFGGVAVGTTSVLNMAVVNIGCLSLTGAVSVGGPFVISSGGSFSLPPGATNLIAIEFRPQDLGHVTNEFVLVSDNGRETGSVTGVGLTAPRLMVSLAGYDFGAAITGRTAQAEFVIANGGEARLVGTITVSGGAFAVSGGGSFNLTSSQTTNIVMRFTPPTEGAFSNDVVFASNGGGSTNPVFGIGSAPLHAAFVADVRTGQVPFEVTFTDLSTGPIKNRLWSFGDGSTISAETNVIVHLFNTAAAHTVQLVVEGLPGADTNTRANFVVATNRPPLLLVSPASLDFGAIAAGRTKDMEMFAANIGCEVLRGTASVGGPFAVADGSPFNIAVGTTNQIAISFRPVKAGCFTNRVVITSDGGIATCVVSGVAVKPPRLGSGTNSHDFGSIAMGETGRTVFAISNLGESDLTGNVVVGHPFAIESGSPFSVPGHGSANVTVIFAPTSDGLFSDQVVFLSNGGDLSRTVVGHGLAMPVAAFAATVRTGLVPFAVAFKDLSTGTITNRIWSFGDGTTTNTTAAAMSHTYEAAGTNTVELLVQGPLGSDTNIQPDCVVVTNCPPMLAASPAMNDFGTIAIGQSNDLNLAVVNLGCAAVTGTASVGGPFAIVSGSPFSIASGTTNLITIRFQPLAADAYTNDVVITSDGGSATGIVTGVGGAIRSP